MGSTSAAERRKESKRGGAARTERRLPPGEASTTGAAQRARVLEPRSFRYAYRTGQAARCRDLARSLKNRMETSTSVPQTREDGALSLRTSRTYAFVRRPLDLPFAADYWRTSWEPKPLFSSTLTCAWVTSAQSSYDTLRPARNLDGAKFMRLDNVAVR